MRSPDYCWTLTLTLSTLLISTSQAQQLIEVRDGVPVEALLSTREATRIRIEGAPIISVVGAVQSTTCNTSAETGSPTATRSLASTPLPSASRPAELAVECDSEQGEIYVRPLGNGRKPVNLFVASPQASYTLLLKRLDIPADTITLKERTSGNRNTVNERGLGRSANPIRQMKALLVAMTSEQPPPDIDVEAVGRDLQLWQGSQLTLLRRYRGRGLLGEALQLRNTGKQTLVLAEQEFDRPQDRVLGIVVEQHTLAPGESTAVFVIRLDGARP